MLEPRPGNPGTHSPRMEDLEGQPTVRCHVGHLFFFGGHSYSQTFLGLGIEKQGFVTWFIGPRIINMTLYTKGLILS